jgi:hypothetical protein
MEKYRKFDDPLTQINPFIPDKVERRSAFLQICYLYINTYNSFQIIIGILRFTTLLFLFASLIISQLLKELLILPKLKRFIEVLLTTIYTRIMLFLLGVYSFTYKYNKHSER